MATTAPQTPEPTHADSTGEVERLRAVLAARERELAEVLEQQTATSEVLRAMSESPIQLQKVLDTIADNAARLCETDVSLVALVRGEEARMVAGWGADSARARYTLTTPTRVVRLERDHSPLARAIVDREVVHIADLAAVPLEEFRTEVAHRLGVRTTLNVPLLRDGAALGALVLSRLEVRPFTDRQIALLTFFADQAVIAIESSRLVHELQESNATLKEALEQQTATADILRTIAGSQADLGEVLPAIARTVRRLCDADAVFVDQLLGGDRRRNTFVHADGERGVYTYDLPLSRGMVVHRAMLEGRTIHVPDLAQEPADEWPDSRRSALARGVCTILGVPMLRSGAAVGGIALQRRAQGEDARPFTEAQIRLAEAFADQAAIAIENARLLEELEERDQRRRQELERAAAIQERLLPSSIEGWPGLLEIVHRFRPAVETSGDFYDVLPLAPSGQSALPPLQVAVGDVAGKGMSAALVTALARSALRSSATVPTEMATPAGTLRLAGRRLHQDVGGGHFVACALAVVEPPGVLHRGPRLRLSNAAQVPVLLVRDGMAAELEAAGDRLPLGAWPDGDYKDAEAVLRPGDVVVFSSDGLVEAPSRPAAAVPPHLPPPEQQGELFGFARLAASAAHWARQAQSAEEVATGMWSDLTAWCGEESHHDDVTLLVLRVSAAP